MNGRAQAAVQESLPPLSGRLLLFYRLAWCALAIGGILASAFLAAQSLTHPAVIALRLVKSAVLIFVAGILLYRRPRDPVAALLSLAFLTWTITSSFGLGTVGALPQLVDRGRFLLFAVALLLFPEGRWHPSWTPFVAIASVGAFGLGVAESVGLLSTRLFLPLAVICVLVAVVSLIFRYLAAQCYALRQQLKWVALGLISGVGLILCARIGTALSAAPGSAAKAILWEAMFQLGIMVIALGFLVSLLRFRLFDAETVISRSAVYAALTVAVVATFGGSEAAIENLGQAYLGMNVGSISGAMAAAVAAVMLKPIHERISNWAEDQFQPDLAQFKREIPELLARLAVRPSTARIAAEVLPRINAAIHSTHSALALDGRLIAASGVSLADAERCLMNGDVIRARPLPRVPGELGFPVRLRLGVLPLGQAVCLLLGPRPDGTSCAREDLDAVRSILPQLHDALAYATAHEAIERANRRRDKRVRRQFTALQEKLSAIEARL